MHQTCSSDCSLSTGSVLPGEIAFTADEDAAIVGHNKEAADAVVTRHGRLTSVTKLFCETLNSHLTPTRTASPDITYPSWQRDARGDRETHGGQADLELCIHVYILLTVNN